MCMFACGNLTAQGIRMLIRPGNKDGLFYTVAAMFKLMQKKHTVKYPTVLNEKTHE